MIIAQYVFVGGLPRGWSSPDADVPKSSVNRLFGAVKACHATY